MAYRFDEYRAEVLLDYEDRRSKDKLPHELAYPTVVRLKEHALTICNTRFRLSDENVMVSFFGKQSNQEAYAQAIQDTDPDIFRPVYNYLRKKTQNPEEKQIELLAWLTDYTERPYSTYVVNHPEQPKPSLKQTGTGASDEKGNGNNVQDIKETTQKKTAFSLQRSKRSLRLPLGALFILIITAFLSLMVRNTMADRKLVYVCQSPYAHRYHRTKNCSGLANCRHNLIMITIDSARKSGRTLCHLEGGE